mmetsp:Transcript_35485/g.78725  ORF Transcript_35485/g.78725 Transcript_35485/m.78725 type:complete len:365 (-) Transcript_35485:444-1538(-)
MLDRDVVELADPEPIKHASTSSSEDREIRDHASSYAIKTMAAGAAAGAFAKTCTAPLARLTILYQVQAFNHNTAPHCLEAAACGGLSPGPSIRAAQGMPSMLSALRYVIREEGLLALWRGNLVTILHRVPYSAVNFLAFEVSKANLRPYVINDNVRRFTAGGVAGLAACAAAYPLDLLRTRMAAQLAAAGTGAAYQRSTVLHALRRIVQQEGPAGLYKGLGATLLQVVPGLALNFCLYDGIKQDMCASLQSRQQQLSASAAHGQVADAPGPLVSLAASTLAGFISATVTFPLDVVRRRMQVHGQGSHMEQLGYVQTWRSMYRAGGPPAFYVGILPEYCKVLPGVAIAFTVYEMLKETLGVPPQH